MTLNLNNPIVPYKEFYRQENPRYVDQMPLIIAEGRVPISVAGVMERRVNSDLQDWEDNSFYTGDAIAYHPDKKFRIVLDAEPLRTLTSQSNLQNGALILPDGLYEDLQGDEFEYKDVKKLLEKELSQEEVLRHPIWRTVARDQALLEEYVPKMFKEMKSRFNYDENMGVYLDSFDKVPKLRALVVYRLEDGSGLSGRGDLGNDYGRLVGVAPEALNAHGKVIVKPSLETALNVVNEHLGK